jgi:hypothetical protein
MTESTLRSVHVNLVSYYTLDITDDRNDHQNSSRPGLEYGLGSTWVH